MTRSGKSDVSHFRGQAIGSGQESPWLLALTPEDKGANRILMAKSDKDSTVCPFSR